MINNDYFPRDLRTRQNFYRQNYQHFKVKDKVEAEERELIEIFQNSFKLGCLARILIEEHLRERGRVRNIILNPNIN